MSRRGAKVLPIRQRTEAWLEARKKGIGASEAAAAIGMSPWQSPIGLWAEKLGLVPPDAETNVMRIGTELEPLIARLYTEQTGIKIRRATQLRQHAVHPFMLASIDRRAGRMPVELKYSERATGYGEPGTDEVPDDVLVQMLHQLAVLDEPAGEVALLRPGRKTGVAIYVVERSEAAEEAMIEREAVFYDHVLSRTEPPVDGSEATRDTLNALYRGEPDVVLEADDELAGELRSLRTIRSTIDASEKARAEVEARIQKRMLEAGASLVRAGGLGEIPWRKTKPRVTTDWKALAGAYRQMVEELAPWVAPDWMTGHVGDGAPSLSRDVLPFLPHTPAAYGPGIDGLVDLHTAAKETKPRFGPAKWEDED